MTVLKKLLNRVGDFEVVCESNPAAALTWLETRLKEGRGVPTAVVVDGQMPILSGTEFIAKARSLESVLRPSSSVSAAASRMRMVVLSGMDREQVEEEAFNAGAVRAKKSKAPAPAQMGLPF